MADSTLELFKKELTFYLKETFERVRGLYLDKGTSLFETLDAISATDASRSLTPGSASIAAQVEHVRFYLDVVNDTMLRERVEDVDWKEIWKTVRQVTPDEWTDSRKRLHASYERVLATIASYDSWRSEYGISCALGILAHTAYHLGGLRQALGAFRSGAPYLVS